MKWANLKANPEKVTISGPASIVNKIDQVVAMIDVTDRKETMRKIASELRIYDKNQEELSEKQLSYLNLQESVIIRLRFMRSSGK